MAAKLEITENSQPTITNLKTQLVTQNQIKSKVYQDWLLEMRQKDRNHRKQWEYIYILQAVKEGSLMGNGFSGLGFGVGSEPIAAVLANHGCRLLVTEINIEKNNDKGWVRGRSSGQQLEALNSNGVCDAEKFASLVRFKDVDMNNIPSDLKNYDFTWSCCALEHLGTLRRGEDFMMNSLDCIRPGGLAVHTTEFTSSANKTIESGFSVFYRRKDIINFAERVLDEGHEISLNLTRGRRKFDWYFDIPPYRDINHIKLLISKNWKFLLTTSIGLIIRKGK